MRVDNDFERHKEIKKSVGEPDNRPLKQKLLETEFNPQLVVFMIIVVVSTLILAPFIAVGRLP